MRCWRSTTSQPSIGSTYERPTPLKAPLPPCGTAPSDQKAACRTRPRSAMVFKLVDSAQKSWRRIDGHNRLPKLIQGIKFTDGIEVIGNSAAPQVQAAA